METKEYIVILNDGVDYNSFWTDIENSSSGLEHIPDRAVSIVNNRDAQPQMCHYRLTNEEAELVKNDPRVKAVEEPYYNVGLFPQPFAIRGPSTGNISFTIPAYENQSGNNVNWGLIRHNYANNPYANTTVTSSEYQYVLDGTGVDVVIMDTGIEYYHPEFQDANGISRVIQYNWTGNLDTTPNSINFDDVDGHGTACAGITSGKNYGWASNSAIYTCKIFDTGSISVEDAFDAIKTWHIAKNTPGDPAYTGRPTVVNGSFGYTFSNAFLSITSINYRDTGNIAASSPDASKGMTSGPVTQFDLASGITYTFTNLGQPLRLEQIDTAANSMIAAGVVFVAAAGNDAHKIAIPTDSSNKSNDHWNYWNGTWNGFSYPLDWRYYNRGSSPGVTNAVVVGAIAAGTNIAGQNQKTSYSNAGYGVDVFAVGWNPRTAYANVTDSSTADYWLAPGSGFKQTTFGGTSAAAPQVAGIAALYLQVNPTATPAQVKSWLTNNANTSALYSSGLSSDYTNYESQWGGNGGVAYQALQGLSRVKTAANTWATVANVYVKTAANNWTSVSAVYSKTSANTWKEVF